MADSRIHQYLTYHMESMRIKDVDPAHGMLKYLVTRFELNQEQIFWLCMLYGWTYNAASVYFIYSEFPDFENVNLGRMSRWWYSYGREQTVFTTDARWRRSRNQFIDAVKSYQQWVGKRTQAEKFASVITGDTPERRYEQVYAEITKLYTMGQFSAFLTDEALAVVAGLPITPTTLDLNQAWSCRSGLCMAYGLDQYVTDGAAPTPFEGRVEIAAAWDDLLARLKVVSPESNIFNVETVLCAYRKYMDGKRVIGSYVDRQALEIARMQDHVRNGVCWQPLWDYRRETMEVNQLIENEVSWEILAKKGLPDKWKSIRNAKTTMLLASNVPSNSMPKT